MSQGCPFEVTPYAQSDVVTSPNIFNLNYTNQDFWSMKTRLVEFIRQQFGSEFNDFVESSLALMLIENWAFLADTLSFKIDQVANELFIDTVTEVENAVRLARLVGFKPLPPLPGRSLWTATINNPILTNITIPAPLDIDVQSAGQTVTIELFPADSENNPIYDQDIIIPAGNITNSAIVGLEGRTRVQEEDSDGTVGQTVQLTFFPVIWDSIRVDVDGVRWNQVEYFTDSQPRREYRVEFDSTYTAFVIFGNSRAGLLPPAGSRIRVTYRQGGGTAGNIVTGAVESQTIADVPGLGYAVPVNFRNYTKGEFGYAGDGIEEIRQKLPAWVRTQNRAVTGLDYKTLADQFATPYSGQVGKATAVLRNHGCAGNVIDLYVLARLGEDGLEQAGAELKTALDVYLDGVKMFTDFVCIKDGTVISTEVAIDVILDRFYRKFEDELKVRLTRLVDRFFSLNNWEYGKALRDTDLIKDLSAVREVSRYDITFTTDDEDNSGSVVTARFNEIIRPDTVIVNFQYS